MRAPWIIKAFFFIAVSALESLLLHVTLRLFYGKRRLTERSQ